ncbi:hypothetical protein [Streptomyces sp. MMG1121]|uniref:hypothetical protein n=1 Tax=Streptomyces sp. MMG1121 TaxID=1415544 RepID=UPI0006ADCEBA|nr:hypothetical protein [Streptomyces sp. MMG1121]KOV63539.1 hypothetical protein ADK64_20890 [Streptomyces sp. MMG1121]
MLGRRWSTAGTALLLAALTACGGGHGGAAGASANGGSATPSPRPTPDAVAGLRDSVRHVTRRTTTATRPHLVKTCTTKTREVRHSTSSGSGKKRHTRTWYTDDHYQDCHQVRHGTETYRREVRPERWCVRLDDVNGDPGRDDVWFRVTRTDYDTASTADDRARLRFVPVFPDNGC